MSFRTRGKKRRGVVLILFAISAVVIFGFIALAFDLGRVYIAKAEAQSFCDAAALAAVLMLDGTTFARSIDAVHGQYQGTETLTTGPWKRYHFQTASFPDSDIEVRFSQDGVTYEPKGPGDDAAGYRFVEVRASAQIPVYFAQILTGQSQGMAVAVARAAQVRKTVWEEGLVPFWITAHCTTVQDNPFGMPVCAAENDDKDKGASNQFDEDVRLTVGVPYAVLWQSADIKKGYNKDLTPDETYQNAKWCSGDTNATDPMFNFAFGRMALGNRTDYVGVSRLQNAREGWGFWNVFKNPGTNLYAQLIWGSIGATISITDATMENFETEGGQRTTLRSELQNRALYNPFACAPVIDPLTLKWLTVRAIEFIPGAYGPNNTWCAIYRDSALNDCSLQPAAQTDGVYEVRLVR